MPNETTQEPKQELSLYEKSKALLCLHESCLNSKYVNSENKKHNSYFVPSFFKVFKK